MVAKWFRRRIPFAGLLTGLLTGLAACGGGDSIGDAAVVVAISAQGITEPLHAGGLDNPNGTLPVGAFLNARISFRFGGPVNPVTLPAPGPAQGGAIEIVAIGDGSPAVGVFRLDATDPRRVFFDPRPPLPGSVCQAGLASDTVYVVRVKDVAGGVGPRLHVAGKLLERGANAYFQVRSCGGAGDMPYGDPNGRPPQVMAMSPTPGSTVARSTLSGFPTGTIITVDIDELLDASTVSNQSVLLVNRTSNAVYDLPIAGQVGLIPIGTVPGQPSASRIVFTAPQPLEDGHDYAIRFSGVTDISGAILIVAPDQLRFGVQDEMNGMPRFFADDFSTTANRLGVATAIAWPGTAAGNPNSGRIAATLPFDQVGNGLDGPGSFTTSMTINSDNQFTAGDPNAEPGTYNFSTLVIGNGTNTVLTFESTTDVPPGEVNWPLRLRSTSTITIANNTMIRCRGRQNPLLGGGNVWSELVTLAGGWGGPGAGRGGHGSPISMMGVENEYGLPGEGAHVDILHPGRPGGWAGNLATIHPAGTHDAFFGGGGAGQSGFGITTFPSMGAAGGGGGAASGLVGAQVGPLFFSVATGGETRLGTDGLGSGAPTAGAPGQPMAYMIPPLLDASGGSGGGAGGDRRETAFMTQFAMRAGGSGSGGGGGLRISAGGAIAIGILGHLDCSGGDGGRVTPPAGFGGGGSGGSILIQCFGDIVLGAAVQFDAAGGAGGSNVPGIPNSTLDAEGGRGGSGVVQLEDASLGFSTTFNSTSVVQGEALSQVLTLYGTVFGQATSVVIDTGAAAPDFSAALATVVTGPIGKVEIMLIGIAEDPMQPGQPATTASSASGQPLMVGPILLAQFDQLDGFRWFQFVVTTGFPASPLPTPGTSLPYVEDIRIDWID